MIELEFKTPLPPTRTWERLTQNEHIKKWWSEDVSMEPVKKGRFSETWKDETGQTRVTTGLVTVFDPPKRLQMNYQRQHWASATRVEFLLTETDGGTRIYLQHSGWEAVPDEPHRRKEVDAHALSWKEIMGRFVRYCGDVK